MSEDSRRTPGFAVLYRWRVHRGSEEASRAAWRDLTHAIASQRGGWGSRLHTLENGWFAAYAQWPSREQWLKSQDLPSPDPKAAEAFSATIAERREPLEMTPTDDLLL